MKVRLFTLAAAAAIALPTEGVAQQNQDSLERALADLNSGLVSPTQDAGGSSWAPEWSGTFRARNYWFDDGNETNNLDIDAGVKLQALWSVNDAARIKVGMAASEAFGDHLYGANGTTPGTFDDGNGGIDINIVKAEVDGLLGLGGTAGIGRDNYHVGSGRIVGEDSWRNFEATVSGIWYDNRINENVAIHLSMLNGWENGYVGGGGVQDVSDDYTFVYAVPLNFNLGDTGGDVELLPYFIRANIPGTTHSAWMGLQVKGELLGFGYDFEFADHSNGSAGDTAFALDLSYTLNALTSIPFVESGTVDFIISDSGEEFAVINPTYHNTAGFSDMVGESGMWSPGTSMWGLGMGVVPSEGWEGRLDFYDVDQEDAGGDSWTEIDISVGTELGGGVDGWFGLAFTSPDVMESTTTFWAVLELSFGGEEADA